MKRNLNQVDIEICKWSKQTEIEQDLVILFDCVFDKIMMLMSDNFKKTGIMFFHYIELNTLRSVDSRRKTTVENTLFLLRRYYGTEKHNHQLFFMSDPRWNFAIESFNFCKDENLQNQFFLQGEPNSVLSYVLIKKKISFDQRQWMDALKSIAESDSVEVLKSTFPVTGVICTDELPQTFEHTRISIEVWTMHLIHFRSFNIIAHLVSIFTSPDFHNMIDFQMMNLLSSYCIYQWLATKSMEWIKSLHILSKMACWAERLTNSEEQGDPLFDFITEDVPSSSCSIPVSPPMFYPLVFWLGEDNNEEAFFEWGKLRCKMEILFRRCPCCDFEDIELVPSTSSPSKLDCAFMESKMPSGCYSCFMKFNPRDMFFRNCDAEAFCLGNLRSSNSKQIDLKPLFPLAGLIHALLFTLMRDPEHPVYTSNIHEYEIRHRFLWVMRLFAHVFEKPKCIDVFKKREDLFYSFNSSVMRGAFAWNIQIPIYGSKSPSIFSTLNSERQAVHWSLHCLNKNQWEETLKVPSEIDVQHWSKDVTKFLLTDWSNISWPNCTMMNPIADIIGAQYLQSYCAMINTSNYDKGDIFTYFLSILPGKQTPNPKIRTEHQWKIIRPFFEHSDYSKYAYTISSYICGSNVFGKEVGDYTYLVAVAFFATNPNFVDFFLKTFDVEASRRHIDLHLSFVRKLLFCSSKSSVTTGFDAILFGLLKKYETNFVTIDEFVSLLDFLQPSFIDRFIKNWPSMDFFNSKFFDSRILTIMMRYFGISSFDSVINLFNYFVMKPNVVITHFFANPHIDIPSFENDDNKCKRLHEYCNVFFRHTLFSVDDELPDMFLHQKNSRYVKIFADYWEKRSISRFKI